MDRVAGLADIRTAEAALGVGLPPDYIQFLLANPGRDWMTDYAYVRLYDVDDLIQRHRCAGDEYGDVGLVFIGDDGGGEGLAYDFRKETPPLVLLNFVTPQWEEGLFQAPDFATFVRNFPTAGWDFSTPYREGS